MQQRCWAAGRLLLGSRRLSLNLSFKVLHYAPASVAHPQYIQSLQHHMHELKEYYLWQNLVDVGVLVDLSPVHWTNIKILLHKMQAEWRICKEVLKLAHVLQSSEPQTVLINPRSSSFTPFPIRSGTPPGGDENRIIQCEINCWLPQI